MNVIAASKYSKEVDEGMGEEPFELMNSVAEVNDKCFYLARTGEDGVNQQCKEVQEIISQKVTEGQTHN